MVNEMIQVTPRKNYEEKRESQPVRFEHIEFETKQNINRNKIFLFSFSQKKVFYDLLIKEHEENEEVGNRKNTHV